jgi:phenylacetic acid degradation operon negative regulatory protein
MASLNERMLATAEDFGQRSDISARSVLVTIFGDTVVPAGGAIWLSDLIAMCAPFGFSDRLVRTSLSRLTSEDWFETERVGRHSKYRLTEGARTEFAAAERRIYHLRPTDWDGQWTLVFASGNSDLATALRWRGYGRLAPGVMAVPDCQIDSVRPLLERGRQAHEVPVAVAHFDDLTPFANSADFGESFGLAHAAERYQQLIQKYAWMSDELGRLTQLTGPAAFAARTMLAHDLRRARLADPDLPETLTPPDWPATAAVAMAGKLYRTVTPPSEAWVASFDGLSRNPKHLAGRLV